MKTGSRKKSIDHKKLTIAYLGGGSRGWAWRLMSDLAVEQDISGTVRLYDIDFNAAQTNERIGNGLKKRDDTAGTWDYRAVKSIGEALDGADFIIASILPATFREMSSDVHAPEKYGVYQSVGDTAGPGGLMRALRTIPMYEEFGKAVKTYSPDAWVVNYTNPMALCVRTLYEVFPEIKAFGCCHEVFGTQKVLAQALEEVLGIKGVKREEIRVNVLGVNHFTWLDSASYRDIDLFPVYERFVNTYYESGWEGGEKGSWLNSTFASAERVKFDLFRRYGLIAAAGDRHLAEFMPPYYLEDPETVSSWKFGLTTVEWRIRHAEELKAQAARLAAGEEQFELKISGEEGVKQIKALCGLGDLTTNVNLPNRGQVAGLPAGAVVETNAVFTRNSVKPVLAGRLPPQVEALVAPHAYAQASILKAGMERDRDLAFAAFLNDPLMMKVKRSDAETLFGEMLSAQAAWLPGWKI